MLLSAEDRLSRARVVLTRRGVAAGDLLPAPIADSWTRCLAAGLDPGNPPPPQVADETTLREARQRRDLLRRLALGEMDNLYHQIAGSNFMIAFAAADGMLLDAITDQSFSATAGATSIRSGTLWAETLRGTNALGTVAETGKPIMVHGAEHFFACYGALTCIAAPVFDAEGALAGVLDASSDCRSRQQHTAALVSMAATQIENGLFRECHRTDVLIALHNRAEYLHTLSAGLVAVDPGGMVLAANTQARFLLQGLPVTRGRRLEELFRTRFEDLLDASRDNERVRLEDRVGSVFTARLENVRVVRPVPVPAMAPPPSISLAFDVPALGSPAFSFTDGLRGGRPGGRGFASATGKRRSPQAADPAAWGNRHWQGTIRAPRARGKWPDWRVRGGELCGASRQSGRGRTLWPRGGRVYRRTARRCSGPCRGGGRWHAVSG